ncbi:hypothetical protein MSAN_00750200 [Mycena sanguinolenta]|uniref:Methyltransferase domain-containing protein n=1 Tax=Mycena sanguinolenta TaxID=230812 RepID=A0A8H6Z1Y8_9AGAR|nr:hypothetical protein MSAN_00750200 [Mycena sanguinolenta]
MSSRAASGRKRLRPAQTAIPSLATLPESIQPANPSNRVELEHRSHYASPQAYRAPPSASAPFSPSSISSSSGFPSPRQFPPLSQASRDHMARSPRPEDLTPYPPPSQFQPHEPPPARRDKSVQPRAANTAPEAPTSHPSPAPSYNTFSPDFSPDSEAGLPVDDSPQASRALPPYPTPPPGKTGWAALSDTKVASAIAVPPRYPEAIQEPYPSPPSSLASWSSISRSESVASSSRLPPAPERYERARSGSQPPHYSPSSSPPSTSPLRLPIGPGSFPHPQQNRFATNHSPNYSYDAAYPTPQASTFYSESPFPLVPENTYLYRNASGFSSSSGWNSGGSLGYSPPPPSAFSVSSFPPTPEIAYIHRNASSLSGSSASTASAGSIGYSATQTSAFTSVSSLPPAPDNAYLHCNSSSLSGSSGGSLGHSARAGDPAMESSQSISTNSSGRSGGSDPSAAPTPTASTPAAAPFVFPSSRSRARPANANPGVPRFKFRGKRKSKTQPGNPEPIPENVAASPLPPRAPPKPPIIIAPSNSRTVSAQNARLSPTSTWSSSSGSSGAPAAPTFYFPSSRTRSHPKAPTQFALGKKPAFFRLGLKNKKAGLPAPSPALPPEHELAPAQQQETYPLSAEDESEYATPMLQSQWSSEYDPSNRESMFAEPPSPPVVTKIGTYPLDAYDVGLIESDRTTSDLLRKVISNNTPTFHNYGGRPPQAVLDLGCGAGHWMLDAATAWRNSRTQIVGFDMVDTTKGIWPIAQRQGVVDNITFVRGNFVKQPLPFPDGSFQLVRMANLALCIPHERWEFVLDQVFRVLAVGGRLEFIDDQVFFPYGKPPQLNPPNPPLPQSTPAPTLDTMIPSTMFSRMSLADVVNPSSSSSIKDDSDSQIYDLYGVEEEPEDGRYSDTDTIASGRGTLMPHTRSSSRSTSRSASSSLRAATHDPETWHAQASAARELEALFEHMMNVKFGIHLHPAEFVGEMLMRVFGGVKEMTSLHLTLAPPELPEGQGQRPPSVNGRRGGRFERAQSGAMAAGSADDALGHCPGLIVWPSTFIPMPLPELEAHVSKHLRVLLSCKSALIDYASEIAEQGEGDAQSEAAMEALWEYQNFLRERFNPPPEDPSRVISDSASADDANSIHESIFSVNSVATEALDAMREYQSELTRRYEVPAKPVQGTVREAPTPTPTPPPANRRISVAESTTSSTSSGSAGSTSSAPDPNRPRKSRSRGSRGRDRASATVTLAPPYSRIELTHVRTFYVYEAVKQAPSRFPAIGRMM